jgi:hypothetical protein
MFRKKIKQRYVVLYGFLSLSTFKNRRIKHKGMISLEFRNTEKISRKVVESWNEEKKS